MIKKEGLFMKEYKYLVVYKAIGAMVCMCFSMLSGHKMIAGKQGLEKIKKRKFMEYKIFYNKN